MNYTRYTTVQGDRFDTIAYAAYGDASMYKGIVEANPQVSLAAELTEGTELRIPIVDGATTLTTVNSKLPPWKRK